MNSHVEESRFSLTLQVDIERVDGLSVSHRFRRDQGPATFRLLDDVEHRVVGIRGVFIAEIHTSSESDVDSAGGDPKIDVWRHGFPSPASGDAARLDRADSINSCLEIGTSARPAAKRTVQRLVLAISRMIVAAGGIGLPGLDKHVLGDVARAVEHAPFYDNAL